jgi:hypothetical protein
LKRSVLARWILGAGFTATRPGASPIGSGMVALFVAIQIAVPVAALLVLGLVVVRPWRREGAMTTEGMIAISCGCLFFWDMNMDYTSVSLLYNSYLFNMGVGERRVSGLDEPERQPSARAAARLPAGLHVSLLHAGAPRSVAAAEDPGSVRDVGPGCDNRPGRRAADGD